MSSAPFLIRLVVDGRVCGTHCRRPGRRPEPSGMIASIDVKGEKRHFASR
jgi:hypothetical protein